MTYERQPYRGLPDPAYKPEFYADTVSKRLFAWIIDSIITTVLCLFLIPFTAFTAIFYFPAFFLVVGLVYRTATIAGGSATWGMRFVALEFRDHRGERLTTGLAFLHSLGFTVSMSMVAPQVVSVVLMMITQRGQGLTDMVLGTVAINRAVRL